jgi:hypothetical protein
VHATLRALDGIPSLRIAPTFCDVSRAISGCSRDEFRILHFSVQADHIHLLVEADDAAALMGGLRALAIRCARAINRAVGRRGRVWDGRYHTHALRTPREVRAALVYVLLNFRKHLRAAPGIDPCSSGPWFDGWAHRPTLAPMPAPVRQPRTWLASTGWRRAEGAIDCRDLPRR